MKKEKIALIVVSVPLIISLIFNITYLTKNNKISAGTSKVLDIRFIEGNNFIKVVSGSGTLTIKYQEGTL